MIETADLLTGWTTTGRQAARFDGPRAAAATGGEDPWADLRIFATEGRFVATVEAQLVPFADDTEFVDLDGRGNLTGYRTARRAMIAAEVTSARLFRGVRA